MMQSSRAVLALLVLGVAAGCSRDTLLESVSPDGRYAATVNRLNGGAMTSYTWTVALRSHRWWGSSSDVFIVNGGVDAIDVSWESNHLLIRCTGCEKRRIEEMAAAWRDVSLTYSGIAEP